jgi:hypothetical protein
MVLRINKLKKYFLNLKMMFDEKPSESYSAVEKSQEWKPS